MEWDASSTLVAIRQGYPVRGEVLAVGPGKYRREYSPDRKKTWLSDVFIPTQVKVGDVVELGGLEIGGYMFQQIIIDGSVHLLVSERDVAIVRDDLRSASQ
jgi:co-chaperonin GroES (HSP10)